MLYPTVPMREILRNWKAVFKKAKRLKKPIIIVDEKEQPEGALVSLEWLKEQQKWYTEIPEELVDTVKANAVVAEALREYKEGKTVTIDSPEKLEASFKEILQEAQQEECLH